MKKYVFLLFVTGASLVMNAQMTWSISHRNKPLLAKAAADPVKNSVTIAKSSLSKSGSLLITLNNRDTSYTITLMADDENHAGIKAWEKITKPVMISNAELKNLFAGKKVIHFYYTAIPTDPQKAMLVRIAPVHICTIRLK
jgi:hypothetical protein